MTAEERKEKSLMHKALTDIITDNANTDNDYLRRVMFAFEIISNMVVQCAPDLCFKEEGIEE